MEALNAGGAEAQVRTLYSVVAQQHQDAILRLSHAPRGTNQRSGPVDLCELSQRKPWLSCSCPSDDRVRLGVFLSGRASQRYAAQGYGKIMHTSCVREIKNRKDC